MKGTGGTMYLWKFVSDDTYFLFRRATWPHFLA